MANLFDQMEKAVVTVPRPAPEPIAPGFINARLDDEPPIFSKQRINFDPPDPIVHMCVCKNQLVMGMSTNILLRIDLDKPNTPNEVELPKTPDDTISGMFLDPTGRHLIVSMTSGDSYYVARAAQKSKLLNKLKGQKVTAVGWNRQNSSETTTDTILLGTSKGNILECTITNSEDNRLFPGNVEHHIRPLYSMAKDRTSAVTSIEFDRMSSSSGSADYFIMLTVTGRFFQFIGSIPASAEMPIFQHIFSRYDETPEHFIELPGSISNSRLHLFYPTPQSPARYFAWMTGAGVYCGRIDVSGSAGPQSVTVDTKLIQYPRDADEKLENPLSMVLTEFHILVLFPDRMKAICFLNEQPVYTDPFVDQRYGSLLGMCQDPIKETIWAFAKKAVYKYRVVRESRDIWQVYLNKKEFTLAKSYCQDNRINLDKVLTREAEYLFANKKYAESAKVYAETQTSFEEITLKFISLEDKDPLRQFLLSKINTLKPQDKTQLTMLIVWLSEIWLNQLGQLKERGEEMSAQYERIQDTFRKFLASSRIKECINENKETIYNLIASHGDIEDMIFFAVLIQDFERVISHYIQRNNYASALELLSKPTNRELDNKNIELFYKFSPILMQHIPHETVSVWISKKDKLDPCKLIPALVQYDHDKHRQQDNEAVRYLEFCIQTLQVKEQAIHNYLLSLYVRLNPDSLMKYLYSQGQEEDQVCYDLKYALRLCAEHDHKRACVHIYTTMGLYDEAVELSLQFDIDLAKQNADKPDENEELKKKLWLKIARHVVEEEKDIKRAMEFLQECSLLKIEDILPFFPDFVTIDNFKDAICESLQDYNRHIETLKADMDEATESARDIRAEIHSFRNRFSIVRGQDKCSSCGFPLMMRAFYLFPCSHRFHTDCLVAEVLPHLTARKRSRVTELQKKLSTRGDRNVLNAGGGGAVIQTTQLTPDQSLKEELDDIVASECVYCGDAMIRSIDKPFFEDEESVARSWL